MKKYISATLCIAISLCMFGCKNEKSDTSESVKERPTDGPVETTTEASTENTSETSESTSKVQGETAVLDEETSFLKGYPMFTLYSEDLKDGIWPDICSYLAPGKNLSPDAGNWLHWKQNGITETSLAQGFGDSDYIGPYPPSGATHNYEIYVIALKKQLAKAKGALNSKNTKLPTFMQALDTDDDGNTGNIISYGRISGQFTGK